MLIAITIYNIHKYWVKQVQIIVKCFDQDVHSLHFGIVLKFVQYKVTKISLKMLPMKAAH